MIQAAVGSGGGSGGFSTKRSGLFFASAAARFPAGRGDLAFLAMADLVWRHQAKASMAAIRIMPIEEASAIRLGVFDAAEPFRA